VSTLAPSIGPSRAMPSSSPCAQAPAAIRDTVSDLRTDTQKMRAMTAELSAKLQASKEVLTESLQLARCEALFDSLTGLKNRRGFEQAVTELQLQRGDLAGTALMSGPGARSPGTSESLRQNTGNCILWLSAPACLEGRGRTLDDHFALSAHVGCLCWRRTAPRSTLCLAGRVLVRGARLRISRPLNVYLIDALQEELGCLGAVLRQTRLEAVGQGRAVIDVHTTIDIYQNEGTRLADFAQGCLSFDFASAQGASEIDFMCRYHRGFTPIETGVVARKFTQTTGRTGDGRVAGSADHANCIGRENSYQFDRAGA
jgi:hypothetical protein